MGRDLRRGDVRWYRFAAPDKERPVVVLTRSSAIAYLGELTVAPLTTTVRDIPTEVELGPPDGLPRRCAVNADHLQTVPKARVGRLIARLDATRLEKLAAAARFALEI